ncbi:MAG: insulinase family protein, partial [Clostridia bacterium]|nr:insulinase family protein [Clostridia bacterium]
MEWNVGFSFDGFTVTRARKSDELKGTLYELEHGKTGAKIAWLDNGAKNKLFSATFKTLPEDSTGVFHILEHTVLCGSEKYPVHEPFVELLKSSMNTFLNAMTFPDKTMYPVSSRNDQDFLNLTEVYLDAVFKPNLLKNPNIFRQEGWHMEENGGELSYKGVVLNEMKGAMSDADEVADDAMQQLLFGGTCYGFNSGGEPDDIPSLTYEQYVSMYYRYYHPSNVRIYLDGAIPVERTFSLIAGYLSAFDKGPAIPEITSAKVEARNAAISYAAGEEDDAKPQFALAGLIGTWQDRTRVMAMEILADYLADNNESPLKQAILNAGLGEDLLFAVHDNVFEPWYMVKVTGADETKTREIRSLIEETLRKEAKALDRRQIAAIINRRAYHMKAPKEPAALIRAIECTSSWLYGGDVMQYLTSDDVIPELRGMLENGGFERLITEVMLEGAVSSLTLTPSVTLAQEKREQEQARLHAIWEGLDESGKQRVRDEQAQLLAWQQTPDTPEAVATIPILTVDEVEKTPTLVKTVKTEAEDVTVLTHPLSTGGIAHTALYFDLNGFSLEDLTRLSVLCSLYGQLPAGDMSVTDIQREIYALTGSFSVSVQPFAVHGDEHTCRPVLQVRVSALRENREAALALALKIVKETDFDDDARIGDIAKQGVEPRRMQRVSAGHAIGRLAVLSNYSAAASAADAIAGETSIRYAIQWPKDLKNENDALRALAKRLETQVMTRANLTVSVTADENQLASMDVRSLIHAFPEGEKANWGAKYAPSLPGNFGIQIPAQISYACVGNDLKNVGKAYDGSLTVTAQIISLKHLWDVVRVQGGAYGSGFRASEGGLVSCYSYRDPSPDKSLAAYRAVGDFLRAFIASGERVDKYVISAVSEKDPLLSPDAAGVLADQRYFSGVTDDMLRKEREEMLSTDAERILSWAEPLEKALAEGAVCVVGHEEALKACGDLPVSK